ncbi:AMP-binding protein [Streptomyces sp. NPDC059853]|uniref:non-ribosomal peptide synthetase n=1 Tax=Streptomyces sp. NPDC059853 TaxID=3346973 RepID=UPI0036655ED1
MNQPDKESAPSARPTLDRVRRWAEREPEQICLLENGRPLSFSRLMEYTDRTRQALTAAGVAPGDLVAVSCSRRGPAVAGMLATWSVGAAYLPMASKLPKGRVERILAAARPAAVLADAHDPYAPAECLQLPDSVRQLDPSTAYVIFTSGSSGTPKGVVLGHQGLDALTRWHAEASSLAPGEWASQVADLGFDASIWEIWGALANGVSLAVPSLEELLAPQALRDFLLSHRIRAGFVPTGLVPGLLDLDWPGEVPLRVLFTGGDRLTRWPTPQHPFRVVNAYGPTECTVVATCHPLVPRVEAEGTPPIGLPLPHVTARVVGTEGRPVPAGEIGELWLSGTTVSLGYLESEGVREVTVPHDLGDGPRRWYRTGDLVTEDPDGVLHYVSRLDDQIQIGGRRTEPAEIAQAILRLPPVADAVVFVRETSSGSPRLAAAITPQEITREEVQRHLQGLLPRYMVPSEVLALPTLPLTNNGKFNIARLRELLAERAQTPPPAADPAEAALAEDWEHACGAVPESPEDTLVRLGAGSLDLISLQARLAARLGSAKPTAALTLTQTLREQAELLARPAPSAGGRMYARALSGPGSLGQEAIVFLEEVAGSPLGYQYQMVLEGPGAPDPSLLARAMKAVIDAQPVLRTRWRMTSRGLVGEAGTSAIPLVRHTVGPGDLEHLLAKLLAQPIRHADHPLISWDLVSGPGDTTLLQREHHLVHDGWSVGVLLSMLQDAYRCGELGTSWAPDDSGPTYFDWAREQREWVAGPGSEEARRFWRAHLAGIPEGRPALPWPVSPGTAGARSLTRLQPLGSALSARLDATAARLGVTPFALMLSAFRRLVAEYGGGYGGVIGSGFANRDLPTRNIVGMFVNVLPLKRPVFPGETAAAGAAAEMALITAAGAHQQLPTSEIVGLSVRGHSLDHNPLYQVMFSQHDAPQPELKFGEWRPVVRELSNGHGKTDLNVIVLNRGLQHARSAGRRDSGAYSLRWEHDPAFYPGPVVTALQQHLARLLDHASGCPGQPWPTVDTEWNGVLR